MNTSATHSHEYFKELTGAGMPEEQAEIIVRREAKTADSVVTKQHLDLKIELLQKDLMLKFGSLVVGGFVATIGIMVGILPYLIK